MSKTVVINYPNMSQLGGIEKYLHNLARFLLNNNVRVIWLLYKERLIAESYKNFFESPNLEIKSIQTNGYHWFKTEEIVFNKNESVTILSFGPFEMIKSEFLANKYKDNVKKIVPYFLLPDTTGSQYFPETIFKGKLHNVFYKHLNFNIRRWLDNNQIYFFSKSHIKSLEKHYSVSVDNPNEKLLKRISEPKPLDFESLVKRSKKETFTIISIGRLDFPHKGYILGLVKAFARLKKIYPQIQLRIIGDGADKHRLEKQIEELSDEIKKDIFLLGYIDHDNLHEYFKDSHLNIGVAGATGDGARNGVLTLVARNYSEECEVYGFLPDAVEMTTSLAEGYSVDSFIEQALQMSPDEYTQRCIDAYNNHRMLIDVCPMQLIEATDKQSNVSFNVYEIKIMRLLNYLYKLAVKIQLRIIRRD